MFRHLILVVCLLAGVAQAAPSTNATDDIEKFLADRGLISQMAHFAAGDVTRVEAGEIGRAHV